MKFKNGDKVKIKEAIVYRIKETEGTIIEINNVTRTAIVKTSDNECIVAKFDKLIPVGRKRTLKELLMRINK